MKWKTAYDVLRTERALGHQATQSPSVVHETLPPIFAHRLVCAAVLAGDDGDPRAGARAGRVAHRGHGHEGCLAPACHLPDRCLAQSRAARRRVVGPARWRSLAAVAVERLVS